MVDGSQGLRALPLWNWILATVLSRGTVRTALLAKSPHHGMPANKKRTKQPTKTTRTGVNGSARSSANSTTGDRRGAMRSRKSTISKKAMDEVVAISMRRC
jgi:hypothetical protein